MAKREGVKTNAELQGFLTRELKYPVSLRRAAVYWDLPQSYWDATKKEPLNSAEKSSQLLFDVRRRISNVLRNIGRRFFFHHLNIADVIRNRVRVGCRCSRWKISSKSLYS